MKLLVIDEEDKLFQVNENEITRFLLDQVKDKDYVIVRYNCNTEEFEEFFPDKGEYTRVEAYRDNEEEDDRDRRQLLNSLMHRG